MTRIDRLEEFLFPRVSEIYYEEKEGMKESFYKGAGVFTASVEDSYSEESAP